MWLFDDDWFKEKEPFLFSHLDDFLKFRDSRKNQKDVPFLNRHKQQDITERLIFLRKKACIWLWNKWRLPHESIKINLYPDKVTHKTGIMPIIVKSSRRMSMMAIVTV